MSHFFEEPQIQDDVKDIIAQEDEPTTPLSPKDAAELLRKMECLAASVAAVTAAWARLVRAERTLRREEAVDDGGGLAAHAAREEVDSAQDALRRLGVDVDTLIGSPW